MIRLIRKMNYTKYSLANMLLLVTVVVLCSIIVFDRQKRTVSLTGVDGGYFEFEVPEVGVFKSKWNDQSFPPELGVVGVVEIGNRVSDYLNSQKEKIGYINWQISSITLHNLELEIADKTWVYIVCLSPRDRYPDRSGVEQEPFLQFAVTFDGKEFYNSRYENEQIADAIAAYGMKDLKY